MAKPRRVICFIDDDPEELARFVEATADQYEVITGTSFPACQEALAERNLARPDLWVLDLYFPQPEDRTNTPDERSEMNRRYHRLRQAIGEFQHFLQGIGQGTAGSLALIEKCRELGGPVVMLTRKGTLEDAIACLQRGAAAVLKKPMPTRWPDEDRPELIRRALDHAMAENSGPLLEQFDATIRRNSHWARFRGTYLFCFGLLAGALLWWTIPSVLRLLLPQT
jgi:DNA-binding NtrC family response regulator